MHSTDYAGWWENNMMNLGIICLKSFTQGVKKIKTMKGLDTVESLSAEASDNLSTNSFCMIKTISTTLGFTRTRAFV